MAKEKEITEAPGGNGTTTVPPSGSGTGDDDIDVQALSCGDLGDLFQVIRSQILVQIDRQENTPKWRIVARSSIQHTIDALWNLANQIQLEYADRPCPGSL